MCAPCCRLKAGDVLAAARAQPPERTVGSGSATAIRRADRLPHWIKHLKPETLLCGYDADKAGDTAAQFLIKNHAGIQRLRPDGVRDWNAKLQTIRDTHRR